MSVVDPVVGINSPSRRCVLRKLVSHPFRPATGQVVDRGAVGAGWMERGADDHPDPSFAQPVVYAQHTVGPGDRHRHQGCAGPSRQPGRTTLEARIPEPLHPDALGEQTHDATGFEMIQTLPHGSQRHRPPAHRDRFPGMEDPVEWPVVPVEIDEGDETGPLPIDGPDKWRVEKGVVIGGDNEWGGGKPRSPIDPQPPQDPGAEPDQWQRDQPPQTAPECALRRVGLGQGSSRTLPVVCRPSSAR